MNAGSDGYDPFQLSRFVAAQDRVYDRVLEELRRGRKRTHWMWFIFPQVAGLGTSPTARLYAIGSKAEASAYERHPVLGHRLLECTHITNSLEETSARRVFGDPDDLKFRSSMTLFANLAVDPEPFTTALDHYFDGKPDQLTLQVLTSFSE